MLLKLLFRDANALAAAIGLSEEVPDAADCAADVDPALQPDGISPALPPPACFEPVSEAVDAELLGLEQHKSTSSSSLSQPTGSLSCSDILLWGFCWSLSS
jgi:hypothetical protein